MAGEGGAYTGQRRPSALGSSLGGLAALQGLSPPPLARCQPGRGPVPWGIASQGGSREPLQLVLRAVPTAGEADTCTPALTAFLHLCGDAAARYQLQFAKVQGLLRLCTWCT